MKAGGEVGDHNVRRRRRRRSRTGWGTDFRSPSITSADTPLVDPDLCSLVLPWHIMTSSYVIYAVSLVSHRYGGELNTYDLAPTTLRTDNTLSFPVRSTRHLHNAHASYKPPVSAASSMPRLVRRFCLHVLS